MATRDAAGNPHRAKGVVYAAPGFLSLAQAAGLADPAMLTEPSRGLEVVTHRTSWVRSFRLGSTICFAKTYDYPRWRDRWRGLGRTTWLAPSRALRECRAQRWLRLHGFLAPEPMLVWESRRLGWLRRALIVTAAVAGTRLDHLLPSLSPPARHELLDALALWVQRLHASGFRDRNLDLRNLLAQSVTTPSGKQEWQFAKLDSPRWRLRRILFPDRLRREDLARLDRSLAELGLRLPRHGSLAPDQKSPT